MPTAHLYLGLMLIQFNHLEEAEKELQCAVKLGGDKVSLAHNYLGGIYWNWREYQSVADELETHLRLTLQATNAEQVQRTIKELRSKQ